MHELSAVPGQSEETSSAVRHRLEIRDASPDHPGPANVRGNCPDLSHYFAIRGTPYAFE